MAETIEEKKSNRGRKTITYSQEDLERQPMILLVCGEPGVGKTYRNKQEIKRYMIDIPETGKKGRKVLAFDTNDDDFPEYKTVSPDHLKALTKISARRIRPFLRNGAPMGNNEKQEVVEKIMHHFRNGLIVLDDMDEYMKGAKSQSMIGALCTSRHKGIDIILGHQSIAKISTTEWENCTWLRLHHQGDDVTRYKDRIPKYKVVRIAQLIVDEQYDLATNAFLQREMNKATYDIRKSFFVYVNMRQQKIIGCSRPAFIRAAKKYIDQEEGRLVSMMLNERDHKDRKAFKNRKEAVFNLISKYLRYHEEGGVLSPF